ncbi:MAG: Lar family restriction alleviation protein [Candidatus Nanoarchaeia archaeon]|jgi:ssDNA-binding Zn-finger/Zn-ribbon topoisomerase 1|nr:Lar family restriction alleviation protein [Candidatus Nanoarchaeia archaeon]
MNLQLPEIKKCSKCQNEPVFKRHENGFLVQTWLQCPRCNKRSQIAYEEIRAIKIWNESN